MKKISSVINAPNAIGPYSVAVTANGFAFLSGQIPINPTTGQLVDGGIKEQTTQVLENLRAILKHLGCSFSDVVKTTIFLLDLNDFTVVNGVYSDVLGDNKPARSTIQVARLPLDAKIEIEMIVSLA